jgi:hypothetical protein
MTTKTTIPPAGGLLRTGLAFGLLGVASVAWGAVSLDITKPPVTGGIGAGPPNDPNANQGQWLVRNGPGPEPFVRSHEFYDNIPGKGGGQSGRHAIFGAVSVVNDNPDWDGSTPITSFTVHTTVTNDTLTWSGDWAPGANSHGESRTRMPGDPYVGDLADSWLTIEFALADLGLRPQTVTPPYTQPLPEIYATNEDGRAWYCYNSNTEPANPGNYFVPAWEFGTIPLGGSVTLDLKFAINGQIDESNNFDAFWLLANSLIGYSDILMNRTTDLKIGNWVDVPATDTGPDYPNPALLSGNASLFHIPEPSIISLLGLIGLIGLRRRR